MTAGVTVLLSGATSQIGVFVLPMLLKEAFSVIALSRKIENSTSVDNSTSGGSLRWFNPNTLSSEYSETLLTKVGFLVSCGPIEVAVELLKLCPNIKGLICLSTSSVYTKVNSTAEKERHQIEAILSAEKKLKSLTQVQNIPLLLLRPTLIYGCGLDENVTRLASLIKRCRFLPVAGKASGLRNPVHAEDLASLIMNALHSSPLPNLTSPVCGGGELSYRQMAAQVFKAAGIKPRILSIPVGFLLFISSILQVLPINIGVSRETILRQNRDQVFDDTELRKSLNFDPRGFYPTQKDFVLPDLARQYLPNSNSSKLV